MRTDWQAQVETMLDEYGRLRDRLASLRGALASLTTTVTSTDGTVTATVGPQGRLVRLTIDPASAPGADRLAGRIVATVAEASARADRRVHEVVAEFVPPSLRTMVPDDLISLVTVDPSELRLEHLR
jgi:DNA-binding protein YbaB